MLADSHSGSRYNRFIRMASMLIIPFLFACGGDQPGSYDETSEPAVSDTLFLAVTDTIGVLQGDSTQVFGDIGDVSFCASGDILILDRMNGFLYLFSPDGVFQKRFGGFGEAPWEFSWPTSFAPMYDSWLIVADYIGRRLVVFDDTLGFRKQITGFPNVCPAGLQPFPDGTFAGRDTELWQADDGSMQGENSIRRWNTDSTESIATYFASPMYITLLDDGLDVKPAAIMSTASVDGSIYCAVSSDSLFQVFGYTTEGELFLELEEPWERVAKTQDEIDAEAMPTAIETDEDGNRRPIRFEVEVDPFHNAVTGLSCDDQGRLWVRIGSEAVPTFRVYGPAGDFLFVARCPDLAETGRQIRFQMRHGRIIAWDRSPDDFPKVYLLESLENTN